MPEQFVGIDRATRRARWHALTAAGAVIDEGWTPADEDGLAILVGHLGPEAVACLEMMSGAAWVRDRLQAAGWTVQIADARKAKAVGSLAAKTDKLDARVLAELARRDLVPRVHVPTFADRELKERFGRRMHLVRLRTAAMNRAHGVLSQFGVTLAFKRLREPDAEQLSVRTKGAHRQAVEVRLDDAALGGDRGRPAGLAPEQPLAPALPRRQGALRRQGQPGQGRRRPQGAHRGLARAGAATAIHPFAPARRRRSCPGQLQLRSGRLTAHKELR